MGILLTKSLGLNMLMLPVLLLLLLVSVVVESGLTLAVWESTASTAKSCD